MRLGYTTMHNWGLWMSDKQNERALKGRQPFMVGKIGEEYREAMSAEELPDEVHRLHVEYGVGTYEWEGFVYIIGALDDA